jgi:hypothetical protein
MRRLSLDVAGVVAVGVLLADAAVLSLKLKLGPKLARTGAPGLSGFLLRFESGLVSAVIEHRPLVPGRNYLH